MLRSTYDKYVFLFFVSLLFVVDIVRKYVGGGDSLLILAEVMMYVVGFSYMNSLVFSYLKWLLVPLGGYFYFGVLGHLTSTSSLLLIPVGLRTVLLVLASLSLGMAYYIKYGRQSFEKTLGSLFLFWFVIIGIIALVQVIFGKSHFLASGIHPVGLGIGDYTAPGASPIKGLFRPTSIFLHAGKVGQVAFALVSYLLYRYSGEKVGWGFLLFYISALIVFGSRAAMVAFFVVLFVLRWRDFIRSGLFVIYAAFLMVGLYFLYNLYGEYGDLYVSRFISVFSSAESRLDSNLLLVAEDIIIRYGLVGAGLGAFSLGADRFGGQPLYSVFNSAENGLLAVLAETGMLGFLFYISFWFFLFYVAYVYSKGSGDRLYGRYVAVLLLLTLLWSNTHNINGSPQVMMLLLIGICPMYVDVFRYGFLGPSLRASLKSP